MNLPENYATGWSTDFTNAPRGTLVPRTIAAKVDKKTGKITAPERTVYDHNPEKLWLVYPDNRVVVSYWLAHDNSPTTGRWSGMATGEQPLAWMPYTKPASPFPAELFEKETAA